MLCFKKVSCRISRLLLKNPQQRWILCSDGTVMSNRGKRGHAKHQTLTPWGTRTFNLFYIFFSTTLYCQTSHTNPLLCLHQCYSYTSSSIDVAADLWIAVSAVMPLGLWAHSLHFKLHSLPLPPSLNPPYCQGSFRGHQHRLTQIKNLHPQGQSSLFCFTQWVLDFNLPWDSNPNCCGPTFHPPSSRGSSMNGEGQGFRLKLIITHQHQGQMSSLNWTCEVGLSKAWRRRATGGQGGIDR